MTITQEQKMAGLIFDFCRDTIVGQEGGLYRMLGPEQLTDNYLEPIIITVSAQYFNGCYRSLILKDDPYILERFGAMKAVFDHSYVCLLNIVFTFKMELHKKLERERLDKSTYTKYKESVEEILELFRSIFTGGISHSINHECTGEDISTCNPDEEMFILHGADD